MVNVQLMRLVADSLRNAALDDDLHVRIAQLDALLAQQEPERAHLAQVICDRLMRRIGCGPTHEGAVAAEAYAKKRMEAALDCLQVAEPDVLDWQAARALMDKLVLESFLSDSGDARGWALLMWARAVRALTAIRRAEMPHDLRQLLAKHAERVLSACRGYVIYTAQRRRFEPWVHSRADAAVTLLEACVYAYYSPAGRRLNEDLGPLLNTHRFELNRHARIQPRGEVVALSLDEWLVELAAEAVLDGRLAHIPGFGVLLSRSYARRLLRNWDGEALDGPLVHELVHASRPAPRKLSGGDAEAVLATGAWELLARSVAEQLSLRRLPWPDRHPRKTAIVGGAARAARPGCELDALREVALAPDGGRVRALTNVLIGASAADSAERITREILAQHDLLRPGEIGYHSALGQSQARWMEVVRPLLAAAASGVPAAKPIERRRPKEPQRRRRKPRGR